MVLKSFFIEIFYIKTDFPSFKLKIFSENDTPWLLAAFPWLGCSALVRQLHYLKKCCILICRCMHANDTIMTSDTVLRKNIPLTLFERFVCERELETEQNCNILTPTLMAISVVSFSFSRAAQPEAREPSSLLNAGFLYRILSPNIPISFYSYYAEE